VWSDVRFGHAVGQLTVRSEVKYDFSVKLQHVRLYSFSALEVSMLVE
jgi:hypothetical protein